MAEKTVRSHSVLRRTMLAGTAGVLGGAVLRSTPVQSQTGTAPAVTVRDFISISGRGTVKEHPMFCGSPKQVADQMEDRGT